MTLTPRLLLLALTVTPACGRDGATDEHSGTHRPSLDKAQGVEAVIQASSGVRSETIADRLRRSLRGSKQK